MLRTSIILAGVALALLSFILFFERGSLSTTELEGRKGRVLSDFVRERVSRVELQRRGVTTVLVKAAPNPDDPLDAGGWRVEAPYRAKADREAVENLLGALEWAEARRSLGDASSAELKQFGLDAPRYRVSYVAGRDSSGFALGAPAADGGGVYLKRHDGAAVYVVGKELIEALDHEPVDYHDKNLHEGLTALTLDRLELRSGEQQRRVQKRGGFFWLENPQALASQTEISSLMDALDGMRASRYVAERQEPSFGFAEPKLHVHVESLVYKQDDKAKDKASKQQREQLSLRIGAPCAGHADESYLQLGEGSVFCVADSEWKKLDKRAEELRELRVLPLDDSAITSVKIRDGERELTLTTQDQSTRFRLTERGKELQSGAAETAALSELYAALRGLKIEGYRPIEAAARAQLEQNALVARFERGKDDAPYVLYVARAESLALRAEEPSLLQVPPSTYELLTPVAARLRKKRVLDENESQFTALTVTRGSSSERVVKTGSGYELAAPASGAVERAAVDELLRVASKLDVVRFVADAPRPEHGLSQPDRSLRLEYTADGKSRTHTLLFGAKTGETGRYAKLEADPAVFVVPNALAEKLELPLPRRAAAP